MAQLSEDSEYLATRISVLETRFDALCADVGRLTKQQDAEVEELRALSKGITRIEMAIPNMETTLDKRIMEHEKREDDKWTADIRYRKQLQWQIASATLAAIVGFASIAAMIWTK